MKKRGLLLILFAIWCFCTLQATAAFVHSGPVKAGNGAIHSSTITYNVPLERTLYVDQSIAVSGDGSSWSQAYKTLSDALDNASGSSTTDNILIAAGTYYPTGLQSGTNRDSSFLILRSGIKIYGGYPAGGGLRDLSANITVLSGNIGNPDDSSDNSYHVLVVAGVSQSVDSVVLDGLIFSDAAGSATANSIKTYNGIPVLRTAGGGVNCTDNSTENMVFRNCSFSNNILYSSIGGGGMYNKSSSPAIQNCLFSKNTGNGSGGAMFNESASPDIYNCAFTENNIQGSGGAIFNNTNSNPTISYSIFGSNVNAGTGGGAIINSSSNPTIFQCDFTSNRSTNASLTNTGGAGIYNLSSSPVIYHCRFTSNHSEGVGGSAVFNSSSSPKITGCLFSGNLAHNVGCGGGIFNFNGSSPVITNSIFSGNFAGLNGGALCNIGSSYRITNCTFSGNYCTTGGAIYNYTPTPSAVIQNTIIWGNSGGDYPDIYSEGVDMSITYCDIQSMAGGTNGNINADPLFVLQGRPRRYAFVGGDYHLKPGSPALDAGDNTLDTSLLDIAYNPRVFGAAIDMGAYEAQQGSLPVTLFNFSGVLQNGTANLQWQTGVEAGLSRFELQESSNGSTFTTVATIMPKGSNSNYSYALQQVATRAYYRLKIIDNSGKLEYGDIVILAQGLQNKLFVYPNPATDHIDVQAPVAGTLSIFDASGRLVKQMQCRKGDNRVRINGLSAGTYYLQVGGEKMQFVKSR